VALKKVQDRTRAATGESADVRIDREADKRSDFLTARQLADVLQVSESTIHRLRRVGRIPAVLLTDKLIRFNLRDVTRALTPKYAGSDSESDRDDEPSPQLAFDDLYPDF
jgi:excisionase family DNA binding protein